jgi:hypothetical protein
MGMVLGPARGGMRIVLVLTALAVSVPAIAEEAPRAAKRFSTSLICKKSGEKTSGLTRICYYDCGRSEGAMKAKTYEPCPRWTPRWRLSRAGLFGPSGISR